MVPLRYSIPINGTFALYQALTDPRYDISIKQQLRSIKAGPSISNATISDVLIRGVNTVANRSNVDAFTVYDRRGNIVQHETKPFVAPRGIWSDAAAVRRLAIDWKPQHPADADGRLNLYSGRELQVQQDVMDGAVDVWIEMLLPPINAVPVGMTVSQARNDTAWLASVQQYALDMYDRLAAAVDCANGTLPVLLSNVTRELAVITGYPVSVITSHIDLTRASFVRAPATASIVTASPTATKTNYGVDLSNINISAILPTSFVDPGASPPSPSTAAGGVIRAMDAAADAVNDGSASSTGIALVATECLSVGLVFAVFVVRYGQRVHAVWNAKKAINRISVKGVKQPSTTVSRRHRAGRRSSTRIAPITSSTSVDTGTCASSSTSAAAGTALPNTASDGRHFISGDEDAIAGDFAKSGIHGPHSVAEWSRAGIRRMSAQLPPPMPLPLPPAQPLVPVVAASESTFGLSSVNPDAAHAPAIASASTFGLSAIQADDAHSRPATGAGAYSASVATAWGSVSSGAAHARGVMELDGGTDATRPQSRVALTVELPALKRSASDGSMAFPDSHATSGTSVTSASSSSSSTASTSTRSTATTLSVGGLRAGAVPLGDDSPIPSSADFQARPSPSNAQTALASNLACPTISGSASKAERQRSKRHKKHARKVAARRSRQTGTEGQHTPMPIGNDSTRSRKPDTRVDVGAAGSRTEVETASSRNASAGRTAGQPLSKAISPTATVISIVRSDKPSSSTHRPAVITARSGAAASLASPSSMHPRPSASALPLLLSRHPSKPSRRAMLPALPSGETFASYLASASSHEYYAWNQAYLIDADDNDAHRHGHGQVASAIEQSKSHAANIESLLSGSHPGIHLPGTAPESHEAAAGTSDATLPGATATNEAQSGAQRQPINQSRHGIAIGIAPTIPMLSPTSRNLHRIGQLAFPSLPSVPRPLLNASLGSSTSSFSPLAGRIHSLALQPLAPASRFAGRRGSAGNGAASMLSGSSHFGSLHPHAPTAVAASSVVAGVVGSTPSSSSIGSVHVVTSSTDTARLLLVDASSRIPFPPQAAAAAGAATGHNNHPPSHMRASMPPALKFPRLPAGAAAAMRSHGPAAVVVKAGAHAHLNGGTSYISGSDDSSSKSNARYTGTSDDSSNSSASSSAASASHAPAALPTAVHVISSQQPEIVTHRSATRPSRLRMPAAPSGPAPACTSIISLDADAFHRLVYHDGAAGSSAAVVTARPLHAPVHHQLAPWTAHLPVQHKQPVEVSAQRRSSFRIRGGADLLAAAPHTGTETVTARRGQLDIDAHSTLHYPMNHPLPPGVVLPDASPGAAPVVEPLSWQRYLHSHEVHTPAFSVASSAGAGGACARIGVGIDQWHRPKMPPLPGARASKSTLKLLASSSADSGSGGVSGSGSSSASNSNASPSSAIASSHGGYPAVGGASAALKMQTHPPAVVQRPIAATLPSVAPKQASMLASAAVVTSTDARVVVAVPPEV